MALSIMQDCDACGAARSLADTNDQMAGGWRNLDAGTRSLTLCNRCIAALADAVAKGHPFTKIREVRQ